LYAASLPPPAPPSPPHSPVIPLPQAETNPLLDAVELQGIPHWTQQLEPEDIIAQLDVEDDEQEDDNFDVAPEDGRGQENSSSPDDDLPKNSVMSQYLQAIQGRLKIELNERPTECVKTWLLEYLASNSWLVSQEKSQWVCKQLNIIFDEGRILPRCLHLVTRKTLGKYRVATLPNMLSTGCRGTYWQEVQMQSCGPVLLGDRRRCRGHRAISRVGYGREVAASQRNECRLRRNIYVGLMLTVNDFFCYARSKLSFLNPVQ
jgi:hypothetical protein